MTRDSGDERLRVCARFPASNTTPMAEPSAIQDARMDPIHRESHWPACRASRTHTTDMLRWGFRDSATGFCPLPATDRPVDGHCTLEHFCRNRRQALHPTTRKTYDLSKPNSPCQAEECAAHVEIVRRRSMPRATGSGQSWGQCNGV